MPGPRARRPAPGIARSLAELVDWPSILVGQDSKFLVTPRTVSAGAYARQIG